MAADLAKRSDLRGAPTVFGSMPNDGGNLLLTTEEKDLFLAKEPQAAQFIRKFQAVLDARGQFPGSTLADLYDPVAMPPALAKAHAALDLAVDRCYRKEPFHTDRERVGYLFALYEQLAAPLAVAKEKKPRKLKS